MPEPEEKNQDPKGQSPNDPDPSGQDGKSTKTEAQNPKPEDIDNLPEKFKGKTATDIAKSYLELEKQYGEQSKSVSEARDIKGKLEKLDRILEDNPELLKQFEAAITKYSGKNPSLTEDEKDSGQEDVREEREDSIIREFQKEYGISTLSKEKKEALNEKIANELADMLDPGGKKPVKDVLNSIPLRRLRSYLEKAYRLATIGDREEQARFQGHLEARQNREASFSSFPSSSLTQKTGQLTEDEKKVAKGMGISDEDYLKQKQAIQEGK